jgi:hypothetical protein
VLNFTRTAISEVLKNFRWIYCNVSKTVSVNFLKRNVNANFIAVLAVFNCCSHDYHDGCFLLFMWIRRQQEDWKENASSRFSNVKKKTITCAHALVHGIQCMNNEVTQLGASRRLTYVKKTITCTCNALHSV